jgi:hypothetical protein
MVLRDEIFDGSNPLGGVSCIPDALDDIAEATQRATAYHRHQVLIHRRVVGRLSGKRHFTGCDQTA